MYGLNRKGLERVQRLKNGGPVRGPGSGTSDSIPAVVPEGSYIMPADSTAQIGEQALAKLGAHGFESARLQQHEAAAPAAARGFGIKGLREHAAGGTAGEAPGLGFKPKDIPVNLSNGEFQLSPNQVHAVGVAVLDALKNATHTPAALQQIGELFFADGGAVESTDELLARIQAKYGTGGGSSAPQPPAAPAQAPNQAPAQRALPAPTIAGAAAALRNRRQQIDETAGFADGGAVMSRRGFGFGPTSVGARMMAERPSFSDGGGVQDPDKPRAVAGAPGVQRLGNEYSAAPAPVGQASPTGASFNGAMSRTPKPPQPGQLEPRTVPGAPAVVREGNTYSAASRGPGDVSFSDVTARSPKPPGPVRFEEPRVPNAVMKRFEELQAPGMTLRVQGEELAEPGKVMASIEPKTGTPATTQNAQATPLPEADFSHLTAQQRNTAGDAYREAWQQQTPGGLRGAGADATSLYNAEQLIRGSGITAQRDANGRMAFSGDGANALPQNYTSGFDMNLANERMARANAIRGETVALQQRMVDDANFARGVTGARKTTPEERRELAELQTDRDRRSATYDQNRLQEELARASFFASGSGQVASGRRSSRYQSGGGNDALAHLSAQLALVDGQQKDIRADARARDVAGDALAQRREEATARLVQDENAHELDRYRAGLEAQRLTQQAPQAEYQQIQNEQARTMAELQRRITHPSSREDAAAAARTMQALQGKADSAERFQITDVERLIDPNKPGLGTIKERVVFDPRTGEAYPMTVNSGGEAVASGLWADEQAMAIRANPAMTREQKVAALKQLGYGG